MTTDAPPTAAADLPVDDAPNGRAVPDAGYARLKRWRRRRRLGVILAVVEVTNEQAHALVRLGLLDAGARADKHALAQAVQRLLAGAGGLAEAVRGIYPSADGGHPRRTP